MPRDTLEYAAVVAVFVLMLIGAVMAGANCAAADPMGPTEVGSVLCCCQTFTGTCCNYVNYCSGIIPGCLCS